MEDVAISYITEPFVFLFLVFFVYTLSYISIHTLLNRYSNWYRLKFTRKDYFLSNLLKSVMLMILTILFCVQRDVIYYRDWIHNKKLLINATAAYVITDAFSLMILPRKMKWSTMLHHICVVISYIRIYQFNFESDGIEVAIIFYGMFSSFAFTVNLYLSLRCVCPESKSIRQIATISFYNYCIVCVLNWTWQLVYIVKLTLAGYDYLILIIYIAMFISWVNDDIVLLRFLFHKLKEKVKDASQTNNNSILQTDGQTDDSFTTHH